MLNTKLSMVISALFLSTSGFAQHPETITPIVPPASYPTATDLQSTSNILTDMVNENREAINMHQNEIHSYYPDLRRISYTNGILTLNPSWPEGTYDYTYNGEPYTATARDRSIQLIDNAAQSTPSTEEINQLLQTLNTQTFDNYTNQLTKQGRAISVNAAFSALPSGYLPDKNFIGISIGHFDRHTAVAIGVSRRFDSGFIIQGRYGASEGTSVVSAGAGVGF